jgi:hypothetical protein
MRIALCFLTIGNVSQPKLWETFFEGAGKEKYNIYCHAKDRHSLSDEFLKRSIIQKYIPTAHGDLSLVQAAQALFEHAFHDDAQNTFFILMSDTTIPIVPFYRIYSELSAKQPIQIGKISKQRKSLTSRDACLKESSIPKHITALVMTT